MSSFDALIDTIKSKLNTNDRKAGQLIKLSSASTSQARINPRTRDSWWAKRFEHFWDAAYSEGVKAGRQQCVSRLLDAVEETHTATTQQEKARAFGVKQATVNHWHSGIAAPTTTSITRLLNRRAKLRISVQTELAPINPSNKGAGWWIDENSTHRATWKNGLSDLFGIYVFYDSRRIACYVGKADKTNLFTEIEQRLRDAKIRGVLFDSGLNKRSEHKNAMCQGEIARYLSIYTVSDKASLPNLEALLIRAFMNSHLNRRRENFT